MLISSRMWKGWSNSSVWTEYVANSNLTQQDGAPCGYTGGIHVITTIRRHSNLHRNGLHTVFRETIQSAFQIQMLRNKIPKYNFNNF